MNVNVVSEFHVDIFVLSKRNKKYKKRRNDIPFFLFIFIFIHYIKMHSSGICEFMLAFLTES